MTGTDVQATLREMWETRPARPRQGRQIAGVSAAIARRYDIDPVLVRVGFVVAAFWGVGAALYIAGWVLLPDEPKTGGEPVRSRPGPHAVHVLVVAAILAGTVFWGRDGGFVLPLAAVAVLLFLLHRSRGRRGVAATDGATAPIATGAPAYDVPSAPAGSPGGGDDAERRVPPAWDPLGAAPFAWDLPEPAPAPVEPAPRRRSRVTPVTLAVALVAGGVTGLLLLTANGPAGLPVLFGVVLAVLGTGLVIGAFTRSGRGLIPFALLLSALTWGALAAPLDRLSAPTSIGDLRLAPVSPAGLAPHYEVPVGSVELDLRRMDLSVPAAPAAPAVPVAPGLPTVPVPPAPPAPPIATRVDAGLGSVEIRVPRDADVTFHGASGVGSVEFGDMENSGPGARLDVVDDLGADGIRSGRPIVLDVQAGAGSVEVHRG